MRKNICFEGVGTAIVTPQKDGEIDYAALSKIIDMQICAGINAIIVGGTTGESATLSDYEREKLYSFAAEKINKRTKLILGTGSCDTAKAVRYTKAAKQLGADGALCITPYYNKGTEGGLYQHFLAIAEADDISTVIYNVPTRTCVNLSLESLGRLCEHENIAGLKESSDSIKRISELASFGEALPLYSGNDYANFIFYSLGAKGAISVISNLYPTQTKRVYELSLCRKFSEALALQNDMNPLIDALFLETNPSVVKFAMERHGLCSSDVRLPLSAPSSKTREMLAIALEKYEKTLHG